MELHPRVAAALCIMPLGCFPAEPKPCGKRWKQRVFRYACRGANPGRLLFLVDPAVARELFFHERVVWHVRFLKRRSPSRDSGRLCEAGHIEPMAAPVFAVICHGRRRR